MGGSEGGEKCVENDAAALVRRGVGIDRCRGVGADDDVVLGAFDAGRGGEKKSQVGGQEYDDAGVS